MIKNIMKNIRTEKAGMPEKLKQAYIDHAKKIGIDSLESLIRNKDKAYVDYNDEIAQIYADELKARNIPSQLNKEQRKKWEEKAANSSETVASLKNFIASMSKPEAKTNLHADEIVEIYKKELEHRQKDPKYRPETIYEN